MNTYQQDLLGFYNTMTQFSDEYPIRVKFLEDYKCLRFSQANRQYNSPVLNNYCFDLFKIKETFLLPEDYNKMMKSLKILIESGNLLEDRVLIAPDKYGFSVYKSTLMIDLGPLEVCRIRIITSNGWLFRTVAKRKFRII